MKRHLCFLAAIAMITVFAAPDAAAGPADSCGGVVGATCGVGADPGLDSFRGLIAVADEPWVLDTAARSGTTAGCGDCTWAIALACPTEDPSTPDALSACAAASGAAQCKPRQLLYRLYLSTTDVTDQIEGTVCLGGDVTVVPVGDDARADVAEYLRDITPPKLTIATRPKRTTLAGLTTYFTATAPASLRPAPFSGSAVTETITIAPTLDNWRWGDGTASGW